MSGVVAPTPAPNVELELAKLANDAMASGADPHEVTQKLHQTISYLRQFPQMAEHATNALADGVATPADISRTLWPHVSAMQHATGSNEPTAAEAANLPNDVTARSRFGGGLASFVAGVPGGEALTTGGHALITRQPYADALRDVRAAESTSPISTPLKIGGAVASMAAIPGSNMAKGALYGAGMGFSDPDPEADRRAETIQNGILGGALGAATDAAAAGAGKIGNVLKRQGAKEADLAKAIGNRISKFVGRGTPPTPVAPPVTTTPGPTPVPGLVGNTPPEVTPGTSPQSINDLLESLVGKMRNAQPREIGNQIGDAELAMRRGAPPVPEPDLEDLLRRSLAARNGAHP